MLNDPLANAFSKIMNAEKTGKTEVIIRQVSKTLSKILEIMKERQYIGDFKFTDDGKGGFITLNLIGKINKCQVIKPRYPIKNQDLEKFEKRYLPAQDFGVIFISTSEGILVHNQAKEKKIGGRLLAYVY